MTGSSVREFTIIMSHSLHHKLSNSSHLFISYCKCSSIHIACQQLEVKNRCRLLSEESDDIYLAV